MVAAIADPDMVVVVAVVGEETGRGGKGAEGVVMIARKAGGKEGDERMGEEGCEEVALTLSESSPCRPPPPPTCPSPRSTFCSSTSTPPLSTHVGKPPPPVVFSPTAGGAAERVESDQGFRRSSISISIIGAMIFSITSSTHWCGSTDGFGGRKLHGNTTSTSTNDRPSQWWWWWWWWWW